MRPRLLVLMLIALLAFSAAAQAGEGGEGVPHWIIAPQYAPVAPVSPIPKRGYAYGWFGAKTRTQSTHHHRGYYGRYVDWIIR